MAFIEYLLDHFKDSNQFEMLCSQVMLKEGYSKINPVGGVGDKGKDAEEKLYRGEEGKRTILFQFSLEKNIPSKVNRTLDRLKEANVTGNELIFVFSTEPKTGEREKLKDKALNQYGLDIDIRGQRYLTIRLASKAYLDVVMAFFGNDISQMMDLYTRGELFAPDSTVASKEQRCLINLMNYTRHPMAADFRSAATTQAIRGVLCTAGAKGATLKDIKQMVFDYLPAKNMTDGTIVDWEVQKLLGSSEIEIFNGLYRLKEEERHVVEMDLADIVAGRRSLLNSIRKRCGIEEEAKEENAKIKKGVDEFFCNLFRRHGVEVSHAILDPEGTLETALDPDSVGTILSQVVGKWDPVLANKFREAIKEVIAKPEKGIFEYLNALSKSYICMQLLNVDPDIVNLQRSRIKESVAVLDTDVVLTGIVHGAGRERISLALAEMCKKRGMTCFVFDGSIEEIEFRIKRSISMYEDLGSPTYIPPDKKRYVSDIFLDIYFVHLAEGRVRSFNEFMEEYYDIGNPNGYIRSLIEDRMGISVEQPHRHYIIQQENKVQQLRNTIEKSRADALSFKNPVMYYRDALAMVIVEQQNREMLGNRKLGRWYLVSGDRHILNAYLQNKGSFRIKPSILPVYFLELLRQCPEGLADEDSFGAILESEAMLRGPGRNLTPIMAGLTKLGIAALTLPTEKLTELIDIMDRADFTQWVVKLRGEHPLNVPLIEQIQETLRKVLEESRSRDEKIKRLKELRVEDILSEQKGKKN